MKKLNFLRRVMPILTLLVLCVTSTWALEVTYDFSSGTSSVTSGITATSTAYTSESTITMTNGATLNFVAKDGAYINSDGVKGSGKYVLFFGKNINSKDTTSVSSAYLKFPGKDGYKITKIVISCPSGNAGSVGINIFSQDYTAMSTECTTVNGTATTHTFILSNPVVNTPYYYTVKKTQAAGKSLQLYSAVVTYTADATAYSVTFNAGTNGTCSTSSLTEASAGAGVTLPSCEASDGYKFLGWTATEGKTKVDDGLVAGANYKPSANTTLYAVYGALHQVTIETPANGTLSVKCGGVDVTSGGYYAVGEVINIEATPADGYKFRNLQVVDASTHTFTASNTKDWTMADHEITIKANFDEIIYRTITWSVNGNTTAITASRVENGTNISFPTTTTNTTELADIFGKKFVGWSSNSAANSEGDLVSGNVAASESTTIFYAVYADVVPGAQHTATLTNSAMAQSSGYSEFTDTDDAENTWNFYAFNATQKINNVSHYYYQITSNANNYHISSPIFSGNVKSVTVWAWNTSSKETRTAYLCSSTETAQPTSGDLGSLEVVPSTKNSAMTFTLEDEEFTQFNIYASAALGFEKIEVTYGTPDVYSNYTTTVSTNVSVTTAQYATYYNADHAFVMPEGLEGIVVSAHDGDALTLNVMYTADGGAGTSTVVPAGEPLLLHATSTLAEATVFALVYTTTEEPTCKELDMNLLSGTSSADDWTEGGDVYYRLSVHDGAVGFYWGAEDGAAFKPGAHKAYLAIENPAQGAAPRRFLFNMTDTATGVEAVESADATAQKFFENGQLFIKKNGIIYNAKGQQVICK